MVSVTVTGGMTAPARSPFFMCQAPLPCALFSLSAFFAAARVSLSRFSLSARSILVLVCTSCRSSFARSSAQAALSLSAQLRSALTAAASDCFS